jgi:cytolysin (calcineurin-like family phosphatase)
MKKLIKQIICSFVALLAVIGLTTGDAYAQLAPSAGSVLHDAANQVIVENTDEEVIEVDDTIDCNQGMYHPNVRDAGSFYQCSNGVPYLHNCPSGLVFNPKLNVCDWPENVSSSR